MSLCLSLHGRRCAGSVRLILAAQDESEFAGMLAHAMAHVASKTGFPGGVCAAEASADMRAVSMLAEAGYDPEGLARYLSRNGLQPRGTAIRVAILELPASSTQPSQISPR